VDHTAYYLSAVIGRERGSFEVRTTLFSPENLEALLENDPTAITLASEGALMPERLLDIFSKRESLLEAHRSRTLQRGQSHRWRYYEKRTYDRAPHWIRSMDSNALKQQVVRHHARIHDVLLAFVREGVLSETRSVIDSVIAEAMTPRRMRAPVAQSEKLESANRQALHVARENMLNRVKAFSSEELASALDSTSPNASQFAADKRKSNRVFGVRFGRQWHYPQFQFDRTHKPLEPFDQIKDVLAALSPDVRGWDRLQWFLEPHEALSSQTPLDVWSQDRGKVVEAARTERWDVRD
jgi:hypothetical protein